MDLTSNFYDESRSPEREEHYRLLSIAIEVPSDEQIAKTRAEFPDYQPRASLVISWEPMSYRIEGSPYGNVERDIIPCTRSIRDANDNLIGLTEGELAAVRENGWRGLKDPVRVDQAKVISVPRGKTTRNPFSRMMKALEAAGVRISVDNDGSVTGVPGQIFSPDAGEVFVVKNIEDTFPTWEPTLNRGRGGWKEDGSQRWMRYPVRRDPDYVQPDEVPVRFIEVKESTTPAPTTVNNSQASGPNLDVLKAGARTVGLVGANVSDFATAAQQQALVARAPAKGAPVFGALGSYAREGKLLDYLVEQGAIKIDGDVIVEVA